jgi:hypothetical protein
MTAPIKPKPDKSPEAQKLRSSLRYVQDVRDQLSSAGEAGSNDPARENKLKSDLERAQSSAHEIAGEYRKSRRK